MEHSTSSVDFAAAQGLIMFSSVVATAGLVVLVVRLVQRRNRDEVVQLAVHLLLVMLPVPLFQQMHEHVVIHADAVDSHFVLPVAHETYKRRLLTHTAVTVMWEHDYEHVERPDKVDYFDAAEVLS